tara:strand:+ start:7114 stop:9831 length:2718 start_codon:yes stop_codon:yes gene_type:complete
MKRNNKNKQKQTFDVYPMLSDYQYVTGIPMMQNGSEYFSYDDYMTDLVLANTGTETNAPFIPKYNIDNNYTQTGNIEYGIPKAISTANPLLNLASSLTKFKNLGTDFKNAAANINPKTGLPYTKADFARNTITNTTDENVILDPEGLKNLYDSKGNINKDANTAENLFMSQNEAKQKYFNLLAEQHSKEYVDDDGNSLLSKQVMNDDGTISYADVTIPTTTGANITVPFTDNMKTPGDIAQENVKDINVQNLLYNDDLTEVTKLSRVTNEGKKEIADYDPNKIATEGTIDFNVQENIGKDPIENRYLMAGGSFPRNNLSAFVYGGEEIPKAQVGTGNFRNYTLREPNITIGTKTIAPINRITRNLPFGAVDKGVQQGYGFNANIPLVSSQLLKTPTSQLVGNINIGTNAYRTPGSERYATKYVDSDMDIMMENAPPHLQNVQSAYGAYQDYSAPYMTNVGQRIGIGGDYTYSPRGLGRDLAIDLGLDLGLNYSRGEIGSNVAYVDRFDNFKGLPNDASINIFDSVTPDIKGNLFGFDAGAYAGLRNQNTGLSGGLYGNYGTMRTINPGIRFGAKGSIPLYTGKGNFRGLKITANPDISYDFQSGTPRYSIGIGAGFEDGGENLPQYQGDVGSSETEEEQIYPPIVTPPIEDGTSLNLNLTAPDYVNPIGTNQQIPTNPNQIETVEISTEGTPVDNTNIPVVEPEEPAAPVEMSFSQPDLTDEQKANMTEAEIKAYERRQKMDSAYNKANAFFNTGAVGKAKRLFEEGSKALTMGADTINYFADYGNMLKDELETDNEQDEISDFVNPIEASRGDKGDFDVNTGVYRATSLGYGDGPRGQLAQMGTETNGMPEPDYSSLQQFLNQTIVSYDPKFLMMQAKNGEEIIDADMELIKQLMAAGADFEIM